MTTKTKISMTSKDEEAQKLKTQAHIRADMMEVIAIKVLASLIPLTELLTDEKVSSMLGISISEIDMYTRPSLAVDRAFMYSDMVLGTKQVILGSLLAEAVIPLH